MSLLERYTPEICSQLRQFAETRQWHQWNPNKIKPEELAKQDLREEVELTYHLHLAAEATGARAGMPPMSAFPAKFRYSGPPPHPREFILHYLARHPHGPVNQSDNCPRSLSACA